MNDEHIVVEGSSYNDALLKGLNTLNLTESEVDVEVLETKKNFLFKKGHFKLKITPKTTVDMAEKLENENEDDVKNHDHDEPTQPAENREDIAEGVVPCQKESLVAGTLQMDESSIDSTLQTGELLADSTLQINVSKDRLEAIILITEPIGGKKLTTDDIVHDLNEKGIVFGIDKNKIEDMVQNNIFNRDIAIAWGKPSIDGDDAKIIYSFNSESDSSIPGIIEESGRIDYKTLNKIRNVKSDDLLIEVVPPTEGTGGTDIYGNEIVAKKGNPATIKMGKNVKEGKNGLKIYAEKDGEVCFKNNTIYVDEVITINGDIDNETGNVKFNGKINIRGNVKSGFKVEAEGDIEVFGVVEGAVLDSKGDIIIHRGIQGNDQAHLSCLGNFKAKYVENANIKSAGNVEADAILHSNVTAKDKITASGKKGLIVGGNIRTGKEVRANILGSNMGTSTIIEVGIDPKKRDDYEQFKAEVVNIEQNIENLKKTINLLNKMSKQQQLAESKKSLLVKSLNAYEALKKKHKFLTEEMQVLSERLHNISGGKIHASVIIYPGVKAIIGSSVRQIYDELHNSTLYIKDGEVTIGPYER